VQVYRHLGAESRSVVRQKRLRLEITASEILQIMLIVIVTQLPVGITVTSLMT